MARTMPMSPKMAEAMRYRGKLVGLPTDFSTIVMFYNKDWFDRCGVPYPHDNWTWQEYLEIAHRLTRDTDGDGRIDVWGTSNQPVYNRWPAWVWMWAEASVCASGSGSTSGAGSASASWSGSPSAAAWASVSAPAWVTLMTPLYPLDRCHNSERL